MRILKTYKQLFENNRPLISFLASYVDTMIWSTEENFNLDRSIDYSDIPDDVKKRINEEISHFLDVCNAHNLLDGLRLDDVAHNFYLSRNGHGTGFFDAKMENADQELLNLLQKISEVFGYDEFEVYQDEDEDEPEKEYEYYYRGSYNTHKAIILSDFKYLAKQMTISNKFLFVKPVLGDRIDMLLFLFEKGVDYTTKNSFGNNILDVLDDIDLIKLKEKNPDLYHKIEKDSKTKEFNL